MAAKGVFLSFEGIDGSGKSSQARRLAEERLQSGHSVTLTPETEILLFTAARRDHLEKTIQPALSRGEVVITDRFADSTRMYQGLRGAGLTDTVDRLHALMIGREPDLTFLIDIDPALGLSRAQARAGDEMRFEDMGLETQRRMRDGFLRLAAANPRFRVIDGAREAQAVAADVLAAAQWFLT